MGEFSFENCNVKRLADSFRPYLAKIFHDIFIF